MKHILGQFVYGPYFKTVCIWQIFKNSLYMKHILKQFVYETDFTPVCI